MKAINVCLVVLLAATGCSTGQPEVAAPSAPTPAFDDSKIAPVDPGLKVGEAAPKFVLKDQEAQDRSLDDLLEKGTVALVFVRSVKSSPFCRQHLVDLRAGGKKFDAAGVQVVAVSSDPVATLKPFVDTQKIPFLVLFDEGGKTSTAYGVNDPKNAEAVQPGTFLIDKAGKIRAKMFYPLPQQRPTADDLIQAAKKIE